MANSRVIMVDDSRSHHLERILRNYATPPGSRRDYQEGFAIDGPTLSEKKRLPELKMSLEALCVDGIRMSALACGPLEWTSADAFYAVHRR